MKYTSLEEELNITQKIIFKNWLLKAIKTNDFKNFTKAVEIIGKEWHVSRTLKKSELKETKYRVFSKALWKNKDKIMNGDFKWNDSKNLNGFKAYSYASKICFLINPNSYEIIYDSQNTAELKRLNKEKPFTDKAITKENWQEIVSLYYKQKNITDLNDEKIFKIDYDLWSKGAYLLTKENQED